MEAASPESQRRLLKSEQRRMGVVATESTYSWQERAACGSEDPEVFFPIGRTGPALQQIEEAKSVCQRCPVVDSCLKHALEIDADHGVWGGMSEDERRALKRRRQRLNRANG